mgnify:CR=1 FL=1
MWSRRMVLLGLALSGCASETPPVFAPLRYDYLTALPLDVGNIEIDDHWRPISAADVGRESPVPPAPALASMGRDRLRAAGSTGRAVFVVDNAALLQNGDTVSGQFGVHVEIYGADNVRRGFAEARVSRTKSGIARGGTQRATQLYDLVKQMMDVMNVEFEYQVRKTLGRYLVLSAPPAVAPPVTQQKLPPPQR